MASTLARVLCGTRKSPTISIPKGKPDTSFKASKKIAKIPGSGINSVLRDSEEEKMDRSLF